MSTRTLYLLTTRTSSAQRSHFALWIPSTAKPKKGTSIDVVGTPLTGYGLDGHTDQGCSIVPIGEVDAVNTVDSTGGSDNGAPTTTNCIPKGNIEIAASQVPPPGVSNSIFAAVKDLDNPVMLNPTYWCSTSLTIGPRRSPIGDFKSGPWSIFAR